MGRFFNIDPETEGQLEFSPYRYSFNNPVRFSDPDGRTPIIFALPYILEGLTILAETPVIAGVATVVKEGKMRAGPGAGLYSPTTGATMSLSTPGELTGRNRNSSASNDDTTNSANDLSAAEERAAKLSKKPRPGKDMNKAGKKAVIDVNKAKK